MLPLRVIRAVHVRSTAAPVDATADPGRYTVVHHVPMRFRLVQPDQLSMKSVLFGSSPRSRISVADRSRGDARRSGRAQAGAPPRSRKRSGSHRFGLATRQLRRPGALLLGVAVRWREVLWLLGRDGVPADRICATAAPRLGRVRPRKSCQAEIGLDLVPRYRCRARRLHLGTCLLGGADVGHVLGQFEDAVEVVGVDDGRYPTSTASDVDRLVVGASAIDDRCKLRARIGDAESGGVRHVLTVHLGIAKVPTAHALYRFVPPRVRGWRPGTAR